MTLELACLFLLGKNFLLALCALRIGEESRLALVLLVKGLGLCNKFLYLALPTL